MRVEQRIGRIDRLGQKFPTIRIVNLHYEDTVESSVYKVLRDRIGMFTRVVGKLQPILSRIAGQISRAVLVKDETAAASSILEDIQHGVETADATAFDLDSLLAGGEIEGSVQPALYDLGYLGRVLEDHGRLIPHVSLQRRSEKESFYQAGGMNGPIRVTVNPEYYEDHLEDVELWSPGSPLFPWVETQESIERNAPQ